MINGINAYIGIHFGRWVVSNATYYGGSGYFWHLNEMNWWSTGVSRIEIRRRNWSEETVIIKGQLSKFQIHQRFSTAVKLLWRRVHKRRRWQWQQRARLAKIMRLYWRDWKVHWWLKIQCFGGRRAGFNLHARRKLHRISRSTPGWRSCVLYRWLFLHRLSPSDFYLQSI